MIPVDNHNLLDTEEFKNRRGFSFNRDKDIVWDNLVSDDLSLESPNCGKLRSGQEALENLNAPFKEKIRKRKAKTKIKTYKKANTI